MFSWAPNAFHHLAIAAEPRNLSRQSAETLRRNYSLLATSVLGSLYPSLSPPLGFNGTPMQHTYVAKLWGSAAASRSAPGTHGCSLYDAAREQTHL